MFDIAFNLMAAFNQAGFLLVAAVCLPAAFAVLGNTLYWKLRAESVDATIIGVRSKSSRLSDKNALYFPVYRYRLADGREIETTDRDGSSMLRGKETGRSLRLLVFPDDPQYVRQAGGLWGVFFFVILAGMGGIFLKCALRVQPLNIYTAVMVVFFLAYGAIKLRRKIIPKDERLSVSQWRARRRAERAQEWDAIPLQQIEDIKMSDEYRQTLQQQKRSYKTAAPICVLIGLALVGGGVYKGNALLKLEHEGARAQGEVVRLQETHSSGNNNTNSTSYYPVVTFTAQDGSVITFQDSVGSNPPSYHNGESVAVLYAPAQAERSAMIDRGNWNWAIPGVMGAFGLALIASGFGMLRSFRRTETL